ncbi:hypothetical protein GGR56DRAFT_641218 [Xylariaceae sp. FL0804]|nr:hypothetical protein GGR56DRAFT_641218 [Xylariaceae sp. FL0804]
MVSEPESYPEGTPRLIQDVSGASWIPFFWKECTFGRDIFLKVMMNHIRNPNLNSSWLFRADILVQQELGRGISSQSLSPRPRIVEFDDFQLQKVLIRKLIPRNATRDAPLDQTCLIYENSGTGEMRRCRSMVVYRPHVSSPPEMPFYHPKVQGIAFLHEWDPEHNQGTLSFHYHFFDNHNLETVEEREAEKLKRTGLHLLATLHKHGEGSQAGYVKRVQHDTIIPQVAVQTTYARLKDKYARQLIQTWAESTDPSKHVFEDLSIASFLIELWAEMYQGASFPGFVDIGCGNGLLVYILRQEGYSGWGFDARVRKSWSSYIEKIGNDGLPSLRQHVLLPSIVQKGAHREGSDDPDSALFHDGRFSEGTFIISNHADELTPWTPLLATLSACPFIMIPCCSYNLSGAKFRAPSSKQPGKPMSAYSSLVEWVTQLGSDCGWEMEKEMLRIPSTRNTGLLGRNHTGKSWILSDLRATVDRYGGAEGYYDNVMRLVKSAPRGH